MAGGKHCSAIRAGGAVSLPADLVALARADAPETTTPRTAGLQLELHTGGAARLDDELGGRRALGRAWLQRATRIRPPKRDLDSTIVSHSFQTRDRRIDPDL